MECIECGRGVTYCDCITVWVKNPDYERADT